MMCDRSFDVEECEVGVNFCNDIFQSTKLIIMDVHL